MPEPGDVGGFFNSVLATDQGIATTGMHVVYDGGGNPTLLAAGGVPLPANVATAARLSQGVIAITFTLFASAGLSTTGTSVFILQYEGLNNRKVDITDLSVDNVLEYTTLANTGAFSPQDLGVAEGIHIISYIKYWGD